VTFAQQCLHAAYKLVAFLVPELLEQKSITAQQFLRQRLPFPLRGFFQLAPGFKKAAGQAQLLLRMTLCAVLQLPMEGGGGQGHALQAIFQLSGGLVAFLVLRLA